MQAVIEIYDEEGPKRYERFSSRLPRFHAMFPIADGWRHVHEVCEAAAMVPSLVALHQAAIAGGKKPSEMGLPALPRGMVFTARLINPEGHEVASGSSTSQSLDLFSPAMGANSQGNTTCYPRKDFECGETAAFQRLLAAVGLGGDLFDSDEDSTIASMGRATKAVTEASQPRTTATVTSIGRIGEAVEDSEQTPHGISAPSIVDPADAFAAVRVADQTGPSSTEPEETPLSLESKGNAEVSEAPVAMTPPLTEAPGPKAGSRAPGRGPSEKQTLGALNRQIAVVARSVKQVPVTATTVAEATEEITRLQGLLSR